eukprot:CAMPEP_0118939800 /NCGR_PEP_ID=MMETSP1169-20130426/29859_1 /TAXON_ID=36882 /ORGANISM="Pyramimonas obovata, Strain CCMP722" /LENGTH=54 /DNA_ID=CAMNT_0006884139 /DNA_START=154 /DNA_END=315 /DNA_ORIENTATION=-
MLPRPVRASACAAVLVWALVWTVAHGQTLVNLGEWSGASGLGATRTIPPQKLSE